MKRKSRKRSEKEKMVTTFSAIPEMSEKDKVMKATVDEITQLSRERNLTVGEARSVLNYAESTICRIVEEMPIDMIIKDIWEMRPVCRRKEKRRQRTQRLLAAFSKLNKHNEAKNQGFELPYRP